VSSLQKEGIKVVPWTVNEEKDWEMVIEFGVDGIITDDPRALISYLRERKGQ
jgi:glycerophosphoryl diester phosphodiesterase